MHPTKQAHLLRLTAATAADAAHEALAAFLDWALQCLIYNIFPTQPPQPARHLALPLQLEALAKLLAIALFNTSAPSTPATWTD